LVSILDPNAFKLEHQKVSFITSTQFLTESYEINEENDDITTTLLQYVESVKKEKFSILESQLGVLVDLYCDLDEQDEEADE
jgi:hypothetical protein